MQMIVLCIFFSRFILGFVDGQNCVYQQGCSCYGNTTYCSGLELKSIPPLVGTGTVDTLILDWNSISSIPAGSLPPNIQHLSIDDNPLTSIDDTAFDDSINTLESASISGARFSSFPKAFGRLRNLRNLYVYNSHIMDWSQDVMKNLGATVTQLFLGYCEIKIWPAWFKSVRNLTDLTLSDNFISTIPDDGLDNLATTLTNLNIQNNSLTSVPKALSKLLVLQTLDLQWNHITDVTWLPASSTLLGLFLGNNIIYDAGQLSRAILPHADSIEQLDIEPNSLTSIPDFSFLKTFTYFDFSNNKITDSSSGALPANVTGLDLNFNNFRSIPRVVTSLKGITSFLMNHNSLTQIRDFEFPASSQSADLGFNFITELTDTSFPANSQLVSLELYNNPLYKISNSAFQKVPHLDYINFQSTRLTRLPLAILSGPSLAVVDFTGCEDLVCTCQEKELAGWVSSKNKYSVLGDCGRTSIYDFYTKLALDCPN